MARNRPRNRAAGQDAPNPVSTADSFQNLAARLGQGADNQISQGSYAFNPISRNRVELENMYRGSWIVRQAVNTVADDMTRAGVDLQSEIDPDDADKIQKALHRLGIWKGLNSVIRWSRLYGGAIGVLLIDGQNMAEPLRPETVTKGQFKGVVAIDRWMLSPSFSDLVTAFGPDIGKPKYYDVVVTNAALPRGRVHHSRVIRIDGEQLPFYQQMVENGWGMSVIEPLFDRLVAFDSTTAGAAQLVFRAHVRTMKLKDYRKAVAAGGAAFEGIAAQLNSIRKYQSNEGLTVIDAEDDLNASTYTFSGLSDVLLQFGQQLSGALQIPLVRLFGQSPAGLNATGDSDIRTFYDGISQRQESDLRPGLHTILDLVHRSTLGREPDDAFDFEFSPLWQMSDTEKAAMAGTVTTSVTDAFNAGLVNRPTAMKELRQSSRITGVWTNIRDEDIDEAEDDPPAPSELGLSPDPASKGIEHVPALPTTDD